MQLWLAQRVVSSSLVENPGEELRCAFVRLTVFLADLDGRSGWLHVDHPRLAPDSLAPCVNTRLPLPLGISRASSSVAMASISK